MAKNANKLAVASLILMIKRLTICFLVLAGVLFCPQTHASIFPNDAKTASLQVSGAGTACGTILTASPHDRTIVYAQISTRTGGDQNTIIINGISEYQNQNNIFWYSFAPQTILANTIVSCTRVAGSNVIFRISYTDYNLTLVPNYEVTLASVSIPSEPLLSDTPSGSLDIIPVYATMTAGDLGIMLGLFALVMLTLLAMLWRKNKFS